MKDNISNIFSINNKTLHIDKAHNYKDLYLFNDDFCFEFELNDNTVDLTNFILLNEFMLLQNNEFYLGTKDYTGSLISIKAFGLENLTICSKLKITSSKHNYYFNIHYDKFGLLKVSIIRDQGIIDKLDIHSIFLDQSDQLNINVTAPNNELITEAGIVLFSKDCNMIPLSVYQVDGNNATFKIDLNLLANETNELFKSNIILNGKIYSIDIEKAYFQVCVLSQKGVYSDITIKKDKDGSLTFIKKDSIQFDAYLENAYELDNKLTIEIALDSNFRILDLDLFDIVLKFDDYSSEISLDKLRNDTFIFKISTDELNNLKQLNDSALTLKMQITSKFDGKIYTDNVICKDFKQHLMMHFDCPISSTILASIYSNDEFTCLSLCNEIEIKSLNYIKIRKNTLELNFTTKSSIKNTTFELHAIVGDLTLKTKSIKKRNDNSFSCIFKVDETLDRESLNNVADFIKVNGLATKIILRKKEFIQSITDTDEVTIINKKDYAKDFSRNTQNHLNRCKKLFSNSLFKKKTS